MRTILALLMTVVAASAAAQVPPKADGAIRFATFNAALNERRAGGILRRLETGVDVQARKIAEVIQRVRPDVLLLQELDRDPDERSLALFRGYLARGENGAEGIEYPFSVFPPSNTGVPAGVDLDGDGKVTLPNDAKGFGFHEGQYAFALLSRLPLGAAKTYGDVLWRDVPGGLLPLGYYSDPALAVLPLSSKTHLAVPVEMPGGAIRVLAAHPTPPVFDTAEIDWNGLRNADEIRLLVDMLAGPDCSWLDNREVAERLRPLATDPRLSPSIDDLPSAAGDPGSPLPSDRGRLLSVFVQCRDPEIRPAVVMGDLNADPSRGDALPGAIERLLRHPAVNAVEPRSDSHGDMTASFNGGMRVDYVLPTRTLEVTGSGVFWPADGDPLARLNDASDHHLVWVDVRLP